MSLFRFTALAVLWLVVQQTAGPRAPAGDREAAYRANNIGVARLEQFNAKAAAESFRQALEIDPALTLARVNLAIALFYIPDHAAARKEAEAVAAADPARPQAHYLLGLIGRSDNRTEDAAAAFERVLAIDPRDVGALVNLGQVRLQQQQYAEAVKLFRRASEAEAYNATGVYNLAVALMRSGEREEGARTMEKFQQLRQSGAGTTFSNNYLEQGRYAEALVSTGVEPELVDPTPPKVTFVRDAQASPAGTAGSVTLADVDADGDVDVLRARDAGVDVLLNNKGRLTAREGLVRADLAAARPYAAIVGDWNNDTRPDIVVLGKAGARLLEQNGDGRFDDKSTEARLPQLPAHEEGSAGFADVDHDGDLDIVLAAKGADSAGAKGRTVLLRNNGDGTLTDVTDTAGLGDVGGATGFFATDYDNRRDVDLVLAGMPAGPALLRNLRDGTFKNVASEVGWPAESMDVATAADVNKDGATDFYFASRTGQGGLWLSGSDGRFRRAETGPAIGASQQVQFLDYDNDGLLDLLALTSSGFTLWRNLGAKWQEVTAAAIPDGLRAIKTPASFGTADLDSDGDIDLVVQQASGPTTVWTNDGGNRNPSVAVRLTAQVSNRSAIGSKVEMRAGSLWQKLEYVSAWPAAAPADLTFGLGRRERADVVRVLWPAGILQAEIPSAETRAASRQAMTLTELDRKPSSCPYLYTWNGTRFEFVTDFLGGGEMGYQAAPGVYSTPDPVEYVRIRGDQLRPLNGRYEIRVTNELEETMFLDRVQLIAVTHPKTVDVYPNEGMTGTARPFVLIPATDLRAPARALDHQGRDVTDRIARLDRQFVEGFPLEGIRGYAKRHALTLELSPPDQNGRTEVRPYGEPTGGGRPETGDLLLLTGWTDYAFSGDNIAAHQAGLTAEPPLLQVKDARGHWQTVIDNVGIPVGRPQTVPVDMKGKWLSPRRDVRIVTSMRIYWDHIQVGNRADPAAPAMHRLVPARAHLRWRGFSAEEAVTADSRQPLSFDYTRVTPDSPWKLMPGRYTREGDVLPLLTATDDMFVVSRPGDEIAVSFDAAGLPPLGPGETRTFLLYADGYSKEMDLNSASPDQAAPLPFHRMTRYPYTAPESYPDTAAHRRYQAYYNTRTVSRLVPRVESRMVAR